MQNGIIISKRIHIYYISGQRIIYINVFMSDNPKGMENLVNYYFKKKEKKI